VPPSLRGVRRRFRRRTTRAVTVRGGLAFGLRLELSDASADYSSGLNELPVQEALRRLLAPGDVFFDVGSNVGFFSLLAAREVGPTGSVHAFEPIAQIAEAVRRNAARNGLDNVTVHAVAVSDMDGQADLLLAEHPGGATLSHADAPPDLAGSATVPVVSLDGLVGTGRAPVPNVVKIDVEGAEMEVLDGMRAVLTAHRPHLVCELDSGDSALLAAKVAVWRERMAAIEYAVEDLEPSYEGSGWHVYHGAARWAGTA
jgi:FkbM family methyltransferase